MTLSEDVFAALTTGSPPLRVYPDVLPPNIVIPACVYMVVAGTDEFHLRGRAGLGRILVRVDVWTTTKLSGEQIMEGQVVPLMCAATAFNVTAIDITGADGFEENTERYRTTREFTIWRAS